MTLKQLDTNLSESELLSLVTKIVELIGQEANSYPEASTALRIASTILEYTRPFPTLKEAMEQGES